MTRYTVIQSNLMAAVLVQIGESKFALVNMVGHIVMTWIDDVITWIRQSEQKTAPVVK